jgi:hypothetical protein
MTQIQSPLFRGVKWIAGHLRRVEPDDDLRSERIKAVVAGTAGVAEVVATRLRSQQALVGVNYKFKWGGPVVAKY